MACSCDCGWGCEPSAQTPVAASGVVPSEQTNCPSVMFIGSEFAVEVADCGMEPSAQTPDSSAVVPSSQINGLTIDSEANCSLSDGVVKVFSACP